MTKKKHRYFRNGVWSLKEYRIKKNALCVSRGRFWWERTDSNHRSKKQQIYSLPPLATRELSHIGAGGRTRTPDLLITNQLLYQLSYTSTVFQCIVCPDDFIIIPQTNTLVKCFFCFFQNQKIQRFPRNFGVSLSLSPAITRILKKIVKNA